MSEIPNTVEKGPEANIPNERIVFNKFDEIVDGRSFEEKVKSRVEDEDGGGLIRCEVVSTSVDGSQLDIDYNRGKTAKGGEILKSRITQTLYGTDGYPCGAGTQFDYIDGEWVEARPNSY